MELRDHARDWFDKWAAGEYDALPLKDGFKHTSPYGTVKGRDVYLGLVRANEEQFLGFRFEIHDELYGPNSGCVRYTAHSPGSALEVSEWFYGDAAGIDRIVSYYNLGRDPSYTEMESASVGD